MIEFDPTIDNVLVRLVLYTAPDCPSMMQVLCITEVGFNFYYLENVEQLLNRLF